MTTPVRRYYRGRDLVAMRDVQGAATRYYHADYQGTTQCLTDGSGNVTDRFASDAWGVQVKRTGSSINKSWFVGNRSAHQTSAAANLLPDALTLNGLGRFTTRVATLVPYSMTPYLRAFIAPQAALTNDYEVRVLYVPPFSQGKCGNYRLCLAYCLNKPTPTGGIVVRKLGPLEEAVFPCRGCFPPEQGCPEIDSRKFEYWEAWLIPPGSKCTAAPDEGNRNAHADDCPQGQSCFESFGGFSLPSVIEFHDGYQAIPPEFMPNNPDTYGGTVPSVPSDKAPKLRDVARNPVRFDLVVNWDCCSGDNDTQVAFAGKSPWAREGGVLQQPSSCCKLS